MKFLLIPDKFKGSLTAEAVVRAMQEGLQAALPDAECHSVLASDGGDGFLDAVGRYRRVERIVHDTCDPLGRVLQAEFLLDREKGEAYIELARASGLVLLDDGERQPLDTSTYGTGLQIKHALSLGARSVYIGLGGSATNDGGMGIAHALGYRFLDADGRELKPTGASLERVQAIDVGNNPGWEGVSFTAINDVNNPLFGPNGAARVYAAQKGATPGQIDRLDEGLRNLDAVVARELKKGLAQIAGTGAAGGTAFGLKAFLEAEFVSGIQFVIDMAEVPQLLKRESIDYILTGEGKIDRQTLHGKLIHGVLDLGRRHGIPVMAVCGRLDAAPSELRDAGLAEVIEIREPGRPLQYNMAHAGRLLRDAVQKRFSS